MSSAAHFILIISLVLGALAINQLVHLRNQFNFTPLSFYIRALIGINLISLFHVIETLFKIIFPPFIYPVVIEWLFFAMVIILTVVRIWVPLNVGKFLYALTNRKWANRTSLLFLASGAVLVAIHLYTLIDLPSHQGLRSWIIPIPYFIFSWVIMLFSFFTYTRSQQASFKTIKPVIKEVSLFLGGYAALVLMIRLFARLSWINHLLEMLVLSLVALGFNLFNFVYATKRVTVLNRNSGGNEGEKNSLLFNRFGITEREMEIIGFICQGKTNKEIAEALYITAYTVRDYCSSIFRKTGVKNRTQLTAIFKNEVK